MNMPDIISALSWAYDQAAENLGQHTGGPHEQEYRDKLNEAFKALETLRCYEGSGL